MATEDEKKKNLARLNAMIIYGLEKGLWDLFGESALATTNVIGKGMLKVLEDNMGLEISGEDPQDMLTEIGRLFVDEFGIATAFDVTYAEDIADFTIKNCVLMQVEKDLIEADIKPFVCPYLNIASAAMRQQLGLRTKIGAFDIDTDDHQCHLRFEMI